VPLFGKRAAAKAAFSGRNGDKSDKMQACCAKNRLDCRGREQAAPGLLPGRIAAKLSKAGQKNL